ncbi:MAG: MFS transporter [Firmicutes bacterium]|nr:MFS transporter [Alicyclobacillaceae bacterium]MCL6497299.1 MFS transporter [Bacillota bacterium]
MASIKTARAWRSLFVFWLFSFLYSFSWFCQTPLLFPYWHLKLGVPMTAAIMLVGSGLVTLPTLILTLPAGNFVDRHGLKQGVGVLLVICAVAFGLRPLVVDSFVGMAALTALAIGFIIAPYSYGVVALRRFPRAQYGLAISLAGTALLVGQLVAFAVAPALFARLGIRATFEWMSAAWAAMIALWFLAMPAEDLPGAEGETGRRTLGEALRLLFSVPGMGWLVAATGCLTGAQIFASGFLPGFLESAGHLSPALASQVVGLLPIGALIAAIGLVPWADRRRTLPVVGAASAAVMVLALVVAAVGGAPTAGAGGAYAFGVGLGFQSAFLCVQTLIQRMQGRASLSGTAGALGGMANGVAILIVPPGVAWVSQVAGSAAALGVAAAVTAVALVGLVAVGPAARRVLSAGGREAPMPQSRPG